MQKNHIKLFYTVSLGTFFMTFSAFALWPTLDASVAGFNLEQAVSDMKNQISTAMETKSIANIQQSIGDNLGGLTKFKDLAEKAKKAKEKLEQQKKRLEKIKDLKKKFEEAKKKVTDVKDKVENTVNDAKNKVNKAQEKVNEIKEKAENTVSSARDKYNQAVDKYNNIKSQTENVPNIINNKVDEMKDRYNDAKQKIETGVEGALGNAQNRIDEIKGKAESVGGFGGTSGIAEGKFDPYSIGHGEEGGIYTEEESDKGFVVEDFREIKRKRPVIIDDKPYQLIEGDLLWGEEEILIPDDALTGENLDALNQQQPVLKEPTLGEKTSLRKTFESVADKDNKKGLTLEDSVSVEKTEITDVSEGLDFLKKEHELEIPEIEEKLPPSDEKKLTPALEKKTFQKTDSARKAFTPITGKENMKENLSKEIIDTTKSLKDEKSLGKAQAVVTDDVKNVPQKIESKIESIVSAPAVVQTPAASKTPAVNEKLTPAATKIPAAEPARKAFQKISYQTDYRTTFAAEFKTGTDDDGNYYFPDTFAEWGQIGFDDEIDEDDMTEAFEKIAKDMRTPDSTAAAEYEKKFAKIVAEGLAFAQANSAVTAGEADSGKTVDDLEKSLPMGGDETLTQLSGVGEIASAENKQIKNEIVVKADEIQLFVYGELQKFFHDYEIDDEDEDEDNG